MTKQSGNLGHTLVLERGMNSRTLHPNLGSERAAWVVDGESKGEAEGWIGAFEISGHAGSLEWLMCSGLGIGVVIPVYVRLAIFIPAESFLHFVFSANTLNRSPFLRAKIFARITVEPSHTRNRRCFADSVIGASNPE